ncbi:MAG: adenylate/guanylate cyclase domain-containing protein, partial [Saprospiraceae bacterium]|nr:adenylate/guanylate cyclase domain-containing protein [Saprospiraceae bacterium]
MRKLAAIMFTDIAGYTAAMEADEAEAGRLRERRREVLQATHQAHDGEILQYSGDGSLSVFDSAVAAVRCAIAIQEALQQAPVVPLRIGIHVGEFVEDEEGIYGHSVNIAARLESLAISGSIFISGRVYEDIHNQPGLSAVRLGDFSLKNVESPVPVYAVSGEHLVVPDEDYLLEKGKVEEKQPLHLPPELTSFVGREEEQRTLSQLLSEKRLVTLTGPGGIGKSRLVAKVAERVAGHFPDGVYFVALAPISDPGLVPDTIARTLGITVNPQKPTIESLK